MSYTPSQIMRRGVVLDGPFISSAFDDELTCAGQNVNEAVRATLQDLLDFALGQPREYVFRADVRGTAGETQSDATVVDPTLGLHQVVLARGDAAYDELERRWLLGATDLVRACMRAVTRVVSRYVDQPESVTLGITCQLAHSNGFDDLADPTLDESYNPDVPMLAPLVY